MFRVSVLKSAKADLKEACDFYGDISIDLKKRFLSNFNDNQSAQGNSLFSNPLRRVSTKAGQEFSRDDSLHYN